MPIFEQGDILRGTAITRSQAYHRIVYLSGSGENPVGVVLTHSSDFSCNILMRPEHIESGADKEKQFVVAHRIQKLSDWGPYKKIGSLTTLGVEFVKANLPNGSMTWDDYLAHKMSGCPDHGSA